MICHHAKWLRATYSLSKIVATISAFFFSFHKCNCCLLFSFSSCSSTNVFFLWFIINQYLKLKEFLTFPRWAHWAVGPLCDIRSKLKMGSCLGWPAKATRYSVESLPLKLKVVASCTNFGNVFFFLIVDNPRSQNL